MIEEVESGWTGSDDVLEQVRDHDRFKSHDWSGIFEHMLEGSTFIVEVP